MERTQKKKTAKLYSPEFRERAVRLAMEPRDEYQSEVAKWLALSAIAGSLRIWVRQCQRDIGECSGKTSAEKVRVK